MLLILSALSPSARAQGPPPGATQLLAHWRFDEVAGTLASQTTGRHPGTLSGGADFVPKGVLIGKHKPWFENGYFIQLNNPGGTVWGYGGATAYVRTQLPVNEGRWHHVVMSATASGELNLHLDGGTPVATGQGGGGPDPPPPRRVLAEPGEGHAVQQHRGRHGNG